MDLDHAEPLTPEEATSDQYAALWGPGTWGTPYGNPHLIGSPDWLQGGLPADWVREGLIPNLSPELLSQVTPQDLRQWRSRRAQKVT